MDVIDLEIRYYAKLFSASDDSMLVLGGQTMAFNLGTSQTSNLVQQLTLDKKSKQWVSSYKAPMVISRANFAALKFGKGILVSGGNNKDEGVIGNCEYFISEEWKAFPSMVVRR
jgi:hypothetical protein